MSTVCNAMGSESVVRASESLVPALSETTRSAADLGIEAKVKNTFLDFHDLTEIEEGFDCLNPFLKFLAKDFAAGLSKPQRARSRSQPCMPSASTSKLLFEEFPKDGSETFSEAYLSARSSTSSATRESETLLALDLSSVGTDDFNFKNPKVSRGRQRPCKGQRVRYRVQANRLEQQVADAPERFDADALELPGEIEKKPYVKERLIARLLAIQSNVSSSLPTTTLEPSRQPDSVITGAESFVTASGESACLYAEPVQTLVETVEVVHGASIENMSTLVNEAPHEPGPEKVVTTSVASHQLAAIHDSQQAASWLRADLRRYPLSTIHAGCEHTITTSAAPNQAVCTADEQPDANSAAMPAGTGICNTEKPKAQKKRKPKLGKKERARYRESASQLEEQVAQSPEVFDPDILELPSSIESNSHIKNKLIARFSRSQAEGQELSETLAIA